MRSLLEVLWTRQLHLSVATSSMVAGGGSVVVAERWTRLVRLDPSTGALLWEQRVEDCWGSAAVADGRVFYLSQAGVLRCFDLADGRPLWETPDLEFRHHLGVGGPVVVVGGWLGYRPMTRLSAADGRLLPGGFPAVPDQAALTWPLPMSWQASPGRAIDAVLVAGTRDRALLLLDVDSGAELGRWSLPAPVSYSYAGVAFRAVGDGRVVFLCGDRTVMAYSPDRGAEVLWEHERPLPPHPPVLTGEVLWLAEDDRVTVIDLARGRPLTEVTGLPRGVACPAVPVHGGALCPRAGGNLVLLDPVGQIAARARTPARLDHVIAGDGHLIHAMGKGHVTTLAAR